MHLNKNASKNAGFTLVELIVVITILAILATIAFISYQGYTTDARNAKRNQDLSTITSTIGVKRAANAIPLLVLTNGDTSNTVTGQSIAGTGVVAGTDYSAGKLNYTILGIKQSDFQDPDSSSAYRIGWTTKKNGQFELAAKLGGDNPKSIISGTYVGRPAFSYAITTADTANKSITIAASSGALLFVGDTIGNGTATGTVTAISSDFTKITLNTALAASTTATMAQEVGGLIGTGTNTPTSGVITNNDTVDFPY